MKFLFFGVAALFSQYIGDQPYPTSQQTDLTAIIDGNVLDYYRAANIRNAYEEQEKSGELCYIGQGFLYSVNGVLQTQDVEKGARLSHYWAKGK